MSSLILRELTLQDEIAFNQLIKDWDHAPGFNMLFGFTAGMGFADFLRACEDMKDQNKISSDLVPSTGLYAFVDHLIVGKVSLRHRLNEYLRLMGGHIGFGVLPSQRKKGYATLMLQESLVYCSRLGLEKVLVTCDDLNLASAKVIEKNGGVFEGFHDPKDGGALKRRYWITISPSLPSH